MMTRGELHRNSPRGRPKNKKMEEASNELYQDYGNNRKNETHTKQKDGK